MQALRNAKQLARFVLVWFALSLGVAIASPLVQPNGLQIICSATGSVQILASGDDGQANVGHVHMPDCPLCSSMAALPTTEFAPYVGQTVRTIEAEQHSRADTRSFISPVPPARAPPLATVAG